MEATATGMQKFMMGDLQVSLGVIARLSPDEVFGALRRHARGERGYLPAEEWEAKKSSLGHGFADFSAYLANDGTEFWIMTKGDRSATTVLLPRETRMMM